MKTKAAKERATPAKPIKPEETNVKKSRSPAKKELPGASRGNGNSRTSKRIMVGSKPSSPVYAGMLMRGSRLATIAQVRDPAVATLACEELSHSQLTKLVLARLRRDRDFIPLYVLGVAGVINKSRAIEEVKALSSIGLHLIGIEREIIRLQLRRR